MNMFKSKSIDELNDVMKQLSFKTINKLLFSHIIFDNMLLRSYIYSGGNINKHNEFGNTPLIYAIYICDVSKCKLLIENGAWLNIQNKACKTPLSIASHNEDIIKLLKQYGAE